MRKMFTKLFGLTLLMLLFGAPMVKAQFLPPTGDLPLAESDIMLVTPLIDVCDSTELVDFKVTGFSDSAMFSYNYDGVGTLPGDSTFALKEGTDVNIQVMEVVGTDTLVSNVINFVANLVDSIQIQPSDVESPICGGEKGSIKVNFTGGYVSDFGAPADAYRYLYIPESVWIDSMGVAGDYTDMGVVSTTASLDPGTYFVAAFDYKGMDEPCLVDLSNIAAWDTAVIGATTPIVGVDTIYGTDAACPGNGMVTVTAEGGTPWSWGYLVGLHDADDLTLIQSDTAFTDSMYTVVFEDVAAGEYVTRIVDSIGCDIISDSTAVIVSPEEVEFDIAIKSVDCFDGNNGEIWVTLDTTFVGYDAANTYQALVVSLDTLTDNTVQTWTTISATDTAKFTGLYPIYYSAFVRDFTNGCDSVPYWNPNLSGNYITLQAPGEITFDLVFENGVDSIPCYGDSIWVNVENFDGGSGAYRVQLEDPDGNIITDFDDDVMKWYLPAIITDRSDGDKYMVIVQDSIDTDVCEVDSLFTIIGNTDVDIDYEYTEPICAGDQTALIEIMGSGGTGTYEYSIDSMNWYPDPVFNVGAGDYDIYVRDAECPENFDWTDITVEETPNVIEIDTAGPHYPYYTDTLICNGASSGQIFVDVVSWSDVSVGGLGQDRNIKAYYTTDMDSVFVSGTEMERIVGHGNPYTDVNFFSDDLAAGTYYIWAVDTAGCVFDADVDGEADYLMHEIKEADALDATVEVVDSASCAGTNDGLISIKVTGGLPWDYYFMSGPVAVAEKSASIDMKRSYGPYGCDGSILYGLAATYQQALLKDPKTMTCWPVEGLEEGSMENSLKSASATADGHLPAYADEVLVNVSTGMYYVVIYDARCEDRVIVPIDVFGYEAVVAGDVEVTDIVCYGDSTGMIEMEPAMGGSGMLAYTLYEGGMTAADTVPGYVMVYDTVFSMLPAGTYHIEVIDMGPGMCDGDWIHSIEIEQPDLDFSIEAFDITCNGASDGLLVLTMDGAGTSAPMFKLGTANWRPFDTYESGVWTKNVVITEPGDDYMVYAIDSAGFLAGCTGMGIPFEIAEPPVLTVTAEGFDSTACSVVPDGYIELTVEGGKADSIEIQIVGVDTILGKVDTTYTFAGLEADTYEYTVAEINVSSPCVMMGDVEVMNPDELEAEVTDFTAMLACKDDSTGIIELAITGASGVYEVEVNGELAELNASNQITGLPAGEYVVVVMDSIAMPGADSICTVTLDTVTIEEPMEYLMLEATKIQDLSCQDSGRFSLQASGGTPGYRYYAELAEDFILLPDPEDDVWQDDSTFAVSVAGPYLVWVIDDAGCIVGGQYDKDGNEVNKWRVPINEPEVTIELAPRVAESIDCYGEEGLIVLDADSVMITKDTDPTYDPEYLVWFGNMAGDTLAINDSLAITLESMKDTIMVYVLDLESGCEEYEMVILSQPTMLSADMLVPGDGEFSCPDVTEGYIEAHVSGGTAPYMYQLWQNGVLKTDYQPDYSFLVDDNNEYAFVVMDANGCTDTSDVLDLIPVEGADFMVNDVTCYGDTLASAKVSVMGEMGREFTLYYRELEEGIESGMISGIVGDTILDQFFQYDEKNTNDQHYEMYVVDSEGCPSEKDTLTFKRVDQPLRVVDVIQNPAECNVRFQFEIAGGTAPFTVMVDDNVIADSVGWSTPVVVDLEGGVHIVSVLDAHECYVMDTIEASYATERMDTVHIYEGDTAHYVDAESGVDTMLVGGEYEFIYDSGSGSSECKSLLTVTVIERERTAPVVDMLSPTDTLENNKPVLVITFTDVVTFDQMGYITVTAVGDTMETLKIAITEDMVSGNTITVDYDGSLEGHLDTLTTYVVNVDGDIVWGDGLPWDGIADDTTWTFTTGADDITTGIDNPWVEAEFKVYPNPFNNFIRIDNHDKLDRVIVSNIAGQRVLDIEYPSYEIRTGNLVTGVYVVTLISNDEIVKSERIIKR